MGRLVFLLVLALTQLVWGGLADDSVLCIEPGGKVAIERAGTLCDPCDDEADAVADAVSIKSAACCACVDVPLPGGVLDRLTSGKARLAGHELAGIAAIVPLAAFRPLNTLSLSWSVAPSRETRGPPSKAFAPLRC